MRCSTFLLAALMLVGIELRPCAADEISKSVVKIDVASRLPDLVRPWSKRASSDSSGSGVILDGQRIITNAHVVQYARQIFVRFDQSADRHPARVVSISTGMDLALLELEQPRLMEGRTGLKLRTGIPHLKQMVNVYGYPLGGDQQAVTEGIVSRIEYGTFTAGTSGLRIQIDAALNPGNSGGPAIDQGQIMGIVFSRINEAENIGYLIPAEEVQRFLDDAADGKYEGKRFLFDVMQTVENQALRDYLQMTPEITGMMVTRVNSDEPGYPLKSWDVITQIGDHAIDNEGRVRIRDDLRLSFQYLIPEHLQASQIPLTVWREGKSMQFTVPLEREMNVVVRGLDGSYPRYFVYGPLVFMPAYQELISTLGTRGLGYLMATRSPILQRLGDRPKFPDEELVVCRVLSHPLTKGYDNLTFAVVTKINEHQVENLNDLVVALRDGKEDFVRFEFAGDNETLVFRREAMGGATEDVQDEEGIRVRGSRDVLELWEPN